MLTYICILLSVLFIALILYYIVKHINIRTSAIKLDTIRKMAIIVVSSVDQIDNTVTKFRTEGNTVALFNASPELLKMTSSVASNKSIAKKKLAVSMLIELAKLYNIKVQENECFLILEWAVSTICGKRV